MFWPKPYLAKIFNRSNKLFLRAEVWTKSGLLEGNKVSWMHASREGKCLVSIQLFATEVTLTCLPCLGRVESAQIVFHGCRASAKK